AQRQQDLQGAAALRNDAAAPLRSDGRRGRRAPGGPNCPRACASMPEVGCSTPAYRGEPVAVAPLRPQRTRKPTERRQSAWVAELEERNMLNGKWSRRESNPRPLECHEYPARARRCAAVREWPVCRDFPRRPSGPRQPVADQTTTAEPLL